MERGVERGRGGRRERESERGRGDGYHEIEIAHTATFCRTYVFLSDPNHESRLTYRSSSCGSCSENSSKSMPVPLSVSCRGPQAMCRLSGVRSLVPTTPKCVGSREFHETIAAQAQRGRLSFFFAFFARSFSQCVIESRSCLVTIGGRMYA